MLRHARAGCRYRPGVARLLVIVVAALVGVVIPATPASAEAPLRGVQLHSLWPGMDTADQDQDLDLATSAGSTVVRLDVGWAGLEPDAKGRLSAWYVDRLDHVMNGARARGVQVIAMLWGTPCWATRTAIPGCRGWHPAAVSTPPRDPKEYADMARWLVDRYGSTLAALEVWNEPNLAGTRFWNTPDQAGDHLSLVRATYPAVKRVAPNVEVIAGAMAGADTRFLRRLYEAGAKGWYDGLSLHPYGPVRRLLRQVADACAAQRAARDTTPLWLTEIGWSTTTGTGYDTVTEVEQAVRVRTAFAALDGLRRIRAIVVYNLRNTGDDPAALEENFGLTSAGGAPKPGYFALTDALSRTRTVAPGGRSGFRAAAGVTARRACARAVSRGHRASSKSHRSISAPAARAVYRSR